MSTKNYCDSILLNNEGCEYLECGNLLTARNCFRDALQFMIVAILEEEEGHHPQNKEMEGKIHLIDDGERLSKLQWSMLPHLPLHIAPEEAYVYQRGVFINRHNDDDPSTRPSSFKLSNESSMIVYNLGLSFHLLGTSTNTTVFLDEALSLYKIAEAIRSRRTHSKSSGLIDLAIYNNMGQVYYEKVDFRQACVCFEALKSAFIYFSEQGFAKFLADDDSDGFVLNASIQDVTMAAAA